MSNRMFCVVSAYLESNVVVPPVHQVGEAPHEKFVRGDLLKNGTLWKVLAEKHTGAMWRNRYDVELFAEPRHAAVANNVRRVEADDLGRTFALRLANVPNPNLVPEFPQPKLVHVVPIETQGFERWNASCPVVKMKQREGAKWREKSVCLYSRQ